MAGKNKPEPGSRITIKDQDGVEYEVEVLSRRQAEETLRDKFVTSTINSIILELCRAKNIDGEEDEIIREAVRISYKMADAMIKAR